MMEQSDIERYQAIETRERARAAAAVDPSVRRAHLLLAELYRDIVERSDSVWHEGG